jgi:purine-nucleoside/S-methyl-5'-thioadenosine phosphorylase / adenosine deaminase
MILTTQDGVSFYQFKNLAACSGIDHRIFTRNSGRSQAPFASLNVGLSIGDSTKNVAENRDIISRFMAADRLVFARQVHGCEIAVLNRDRKKSSSADSDRSITADAMVTDICGTNIVIQVADCQAVLLYEPTQRVIANVHCGWRGSIQNIIGRTVAIMEIHFGCRPDRIHAGIGPSLGPCCAEFINYRKEIPMEFWQYKGLNEHFDFWSLSWDQLKAAGVAETKIESSGICTRCQTDSFFSYRAERTTGRFAAVIGLTATKRTS